MPPAAFAIPMRTRFRGIEVREGVLLRGPAGWGEFSPFWGYDAAECVPWLRAAREAADDGWPAPRRTSIPVNAIVPAVGPERAAQAVRSSHGCRTVKVKVAEPGQGEGEDLARVEAVHDTLGPGGRVRVDANGGWDVDTAVRMIRLLSRFDLEYVEQPCRTVPELAAVRRRVDVPIAADESIRNADDPMRVVLAGAADVAVLKVAPLGGVGRALEVAQACGLPVVVSSALDTSVGLSAGLALAAALPELPYACGLASLALLEGDVTSDPLQVVDGAMAVRRCAADAWADVAADEATERRWQERMVAVSDLMEHGNGG